MAEANTNPRSITPSDYFAAERTYLAWIRTGIALMGFGFVVARFGLFLQEMIYVSKMPAPGRLGYSLWFGTALLLLGVFLNIDASLHHVRVVRDLNRGELALNRPSVAAIVVALALAVIGLATAAYLIAV